MFKIVVIGDSGVGKTNLVSQFVDGVFFDDEKPTVGVEFSSKSLRLGEKDIRCQIWDTAGQERFRSVTKAYYNGAAGAIVAFDLTNSRSFESVGRWIEEAEENTKKETVVLLVGNKSDLGHKREVSLEKVEGWLSLNKNRVVYMETSALSGDNVEQAFTALIQGICEQKKLEMEDLKLGKKSSVRSKAKGEPQVSTPPEEPVRLKREKFDYI